LVYSGYDFFDSDEWHGGIGERGAPKPLSHGASRRSLASAKGDETRLRTETFAYGSKPPPMPEHQPHFGLLLVTCERGEFRPYADGVILYDHNGAREILIPKGAGMPGRREVLDDMAAAIRTGTPPLQDGRWGKATLEVALALLRSAREGREITLEHQVGVRKSR
jgi:phthalate 4,5-cis-dihydrodiol dehydrogenase